MNFELLIGKIFQEQEFYELLLFEIEENFELHFSKFVHFYFDRTADKKIKITEIVFFESSNEIDKKSRAIIEKREWFEIAHNHNHLDLLLCRFDRTGTVSSVWKDRTRTHDWRHGWADEAPDLGPMTRDEIRQGCLELTGFFEVQVELVKLRDKKAV